jgi:hypothetical protein
MTEQQPPTPPRTLTEVIEILREASHKHPKNRTWPHLRGEGLSSGVLRKMADVLTYWTSTVDSETAYVWSGEPIAPASLPEAPAWEISHDTQVPAAHPHYAGHVQAVWVADALTAPAALEDEASPKAPALRKRGRPRKP